MSNPTLATRLVVPFEELRMTDVDIVGGKNASLGEMISQLAATGVRVPGGFATTAHAFREFLEFGGLTERIAARLKSLDTDDVRALAEAGTEIRHWIGDAPFPPELEKEVRADFLFEVGGKRLFLDPLADLGAGACKRAHVVGVERLQARGDALGQAAELQELAERVRGRREAARDADAGGGQLADHLAEAGILAADDVDVGHPQLFEWDDQSGGQCGVGHEKTPR